MSTWLESHSWEILGILAILGGALMLALRIIPRRHAASIRRVQDALAASERRIDRERQDADRRISAAFRRIDDERDKREELHRQVIEGLADIKAEQRANASELARVGQAQVTQMQGIAQQVADIAKRFDEIRLHDTRLVRLEEWRDEVKERGCGIICPPQGPRAA
jgi:hypothetical protein